MSWIHTRLGLVPNKKVRLINQITCSLNIVTVYTRFGYADVDLAQFPKPKEVVEDKKQDDEVKNDETEKTEEEKKQDGEEVVKKDEEKTDKD